jgi:hypothetical protein
VSSDLVDNSIFNIQNLIEVKSMCLLDVQCEKKNTFKPVPYPIMLSIIATAVSAGIDSYRVCQECEEKNDVGGHKTKLSLVAVVSFVLH